MPLPTVTPSFCNASQNSAYSLLASSGGAAVIKLGRRCPRASPYSVNCETTSALPFTSSKERFIFPAASSKTRRFASFSAMDTATSELSSFPTPSRIISPAPISPVTWPATVTFARLTLCATARISPLCGCAKPCPVIPRAAVWPEESLFPGSLLRFSLCGLPRQQIRQLRHVITKNRQHLCPLRQIIPPHMVQHIGLRMVHLLVVCGLLHAPETGHARLVKRHMIGPSLAPQRRLCNPKRLSQRIKHAVYRLPGVVIPHQPDGQHFARSAVVHQHSRDFSQLILVRLDIRFRAVQPLLLAAEQHKPDRALRFHARFL